VKTYESIIKGENIPEPGIPESFKVLLKELQSLGLDVRVLRDLGNGETEEVDMSENIDYSDVNMDLRDIIEGDPSYADKEESSFGKFGFQTQEIKDGEFVDVDSDEEYEEEIDDSYDDSYGDDSEIDE